MNSVSRLAAVSLIALAIGSPARAQEERPPVFEMSNRPPAEAAKQPAEPQPAVEEASASAEPTAGSTSASAEPGPPKPRTFALGVAVLSEHGLVSAVARLRKNHVALDVSYGINPILVSYTEPESESPAFGAAMSWVHVDGSLVLFFSDDQQRFQNGLRFGSIYDRIIGFGGMLGWVGELGFDRLALGFGAGLKVFPRYEERVRDRFDIDDEVDFPIPLWLGVYFGINLRWYLF